MSKRQSKPALLIRVLTEIGKGRISEKFIVDKHEFVHGETVGRHMTINPAIAICDTLIHECLHVIEPEWHERYVRRTTTWLLRRMSNEQIEALYHEYQKLTKRRSRRVRSLPAPGSGLGRQSDAPNDLQKMRGGTSGPPSD